jgi:hypothetical protein
MNNIKTPAQITVPFLISMFLGTLKATSQHPGGNALQIEIWKKEIFTAQRQPAP